MARPRSEEANRAAVAAAVEVLLAEGIEGVTLEEVAARSGVAKSTLYRHFGSKEALLATAARTCILTHPTPDTGHLADDLRALFRSYEESEEAARYLDLIPMLIDAGRRDPKMAEVVNEVLEQRHRPIRTVLQLAQLRGEIGRELDLDTAIALIAGPFSYRRLVERREVTPEFREVALQGAIAALLATGDRTAAATI